MGIGLLVHVDQAVVNVRRHHGDDLAALDAAIERRRIGGHAQDQGAAPARAAFDRARPSVAVSKGEEKGERQCEQETRFPGNFLSNKICMLTLRLISKTFTIVTVHTMHQRADVVDVFETVNQSGQLVGAAAL